MKDQLKYRMYGLVPYNISPIQQGIQFGHAVQEYNNAYFHDSDFKSWRLVWKTFIILNGGTTNNAFSLNTGNPIGSLNQHLLKLKENEVRFETFSEPDLGNQLTAIVFLVDERVFDKEKYPDFTVGHVLNNFRTYTDWLDSIGGKKNEFLRGFLPQFKLA